MAKVLVVDDEAAICWAFRSLLEQAGHEPITAATAAGALKAFRREAPDAVFLDVRLPDGSGLDVLERMRAERPDAPVVVMTGHGGLETAVRAMQSGAIDYLVKPLDLASLRDVLARALSARRAMAQPADGSAEPPPDSLLVGKSQAMQEVYKRIGAVASADVPVLIQGESGTGKELVARAIHAASARRTGPLEAIDCASLPGELVESELYGHERGAFTGAVRERAGRVQLAHKGTLFLDEIGELPLPAQAKLLRFLAERELVRIGGGDRVPVDVRVVAATNRPLERAVKDGLFREDLFYRLNVFTIQLPPLRERRGDIAALAARFLARYRLAPGALSQGALEALTRHDWPGNVRELRNAVEHAVVVARGGEIGPEHLPGYLVSREARPDDLRPLAARIIDDAIAAHVPPPKLAAERIESALVEEAYRRAGGSVSGTARLLGMSRMTARRVLRKLGLVAAAGAGGAEEAAEAGDGPEAAGDAQKEH